MAQGKKSVIIYADWIDKFEELEDDEAGRLIKHFFRYVNDLNPIAPDRITKLSFLDIEKSLKRDLVKWEERAERSRTNGLKGGRPTNLKEPEKTQQVISEPKKPDNVNANANANDNDNVSDNVILLKKETKEITHVSSPPAIPPAPNIDFEKLKKFFNDNRGGLPELKILTDSRKTRLKNLEKKYGKELIQIVIEKTRDSDFLQGNTEKGWKASFDWITNPTNFIKIAEDNYLNGNNGKSRPKPTGEKTNAEIFNDGMQSRWAKDIRFKL